MVAAFHAHQAVAGRWTKPGRWAARLALLSAGAVVTGAAAMLANKTMYQVPAWNHKTLSGCAPVSVAKALNFPIFHLLLKRRRSRPSRTNPIESPMLSGVLPDLHKPDTPRRWCQRWHLLFLPSMLDLATTILLNMAYERAPGSVVAIVTSSSILIVALLSKWLLKTKYQYVQWAGIALAFVGLGVVSCSDALKIHQRARLSALTGKDLIGGVFAACSMLTVGLCWCLEERNLKRKYFEPAEQVGIEGLMQVAVLLLLVYPIASLPGSDHGQIEDVAQAAHLMFGGGPDGTALASLGATELVALALYNPLSQAVGAASGSVLRTLCAAVRVAIVWSVGVLVWHATGGRFAAG